MDQENSSPGSVGLASPLRPLLSYGIPFVGAGVWAFAKFPERLRWTDEVFARVFGLVATFYEDLTHVEGYGEALDAAIDALEVAPTRVLDLGCGTGYAARRIQEAFPEAEVVGIDLSPEMVLMARREADEDGFDIEFEVGDASELEFDDEAFDLVVSLNVPPHTDETMRVLAPSGTALTVWSFGGPWVGLAWPALAKELRKAGAFRTDGHRAGLGFYGVAEKSGIRRRRPRREADGARERPRGRRNGAATGAARRGASTFAPPPPPPPPPKPKAPAPSATGRGAPRKSAAKRAAEKAPARTTGSGRAAQAKAAGARRPAPKPGASTAKPRASAAKPGASTAKPSARSASRSGRAAKAAAPAEERRPGGSTA